MILAGGVGSRLGAGIPKQFVEVMGKPVLVYTIEAFQEHPEIDGIEVVCIEAYMNELKALVEKYNLSKVKWITQGGEDFQHSVLNGIKNLEMTADENDILLIHYGASPFVSEDIISDCIRVAKEKGNSTSATPCYLLMGSNDGDYSAQWVDRDKVMQLNSPQCFKYGYVQALYERAEKEKLLETVEPHTTSLMYLMGEKIYFAKGNQTNIKITTKEDLKLFYGYVLAKQSKKVSEETRCTS